MNNNETVAYVFDAGKELIKNSPLGVELTDDQCALLAAIVEFSGLKAGAFLLQEGETDDSLHVLVSGRLEVVKSDQGGRYVTLHVMKPGDMAGELGFIDGMPHSAGLRAITDCEVFSIHKGDFDTLIAHEPDLIYKVMRAIVRAVHKILRGMNLQHAQLTDYIAGQNGRY
ncbi:MAG: cyclic nucleotide-binding domain-containing protein [Chromatiaceae bacterium]|nr:cyclic nucleotide-binding domain-containing protein [Chromatiaceae bacterium]MCP5446942.1 cyclic nucleotide-binding domain-containing protein [Chromatiaceae bacterium]